MSHRPLNAAVVDACVLIADILTSRAVEKHSRARPTAISHSMAARA